MFKSLNTWEIYSELHSIITAKNIYVPCMYTHKRIQREINLLLNSSCFNLYFMGSKSALVYQLIYMYYGSMSSCANMNGGFVALRCQWTYCFVHWATNILHIVLLLVTETFFFLVKLNKKGILWIFTGIWTGNMTPGCYPVPVITIRNYRNLSKHTMSLHV